MDWKAESLAVKALTSVVFCQTSELGDPNSWTTGAKAMNPITTANMDKTAIKITATANTKSS